MDLMLLRLNVLWDFEDEVVIVGVEYCYLICFFGVGVFLKDDVNELGMGVIDSVGSVYVVMFS